MREENKRKALNSAEGLLTEIFDSFRTAKSSTEKGSRPFDVLQDELAKNASRLIVADLIGIKEMVSMLMQLSGVDYGEDDGKESNSTMLQEFLRRSEEVA